MPLYPLHAAEISVPANSSPSYLTSDRKEVGIVLIFNYLMTHTKNHFKAFLTLCKEKEKSNTSELSNYQYACYRKPDKTI